MKDIIRRNKGLIDKSDDAGQGVIESQSELVVMDLLNMAFVCIFDGNFEKAVGFFRQVQNYFPHNYLVANNLATCKVFLNHVLEAVRTLESMVKTSEGTPLNE